MGTWADAHLASLNASELQT
jgi:hypothetical protein